MKIFFTITLTILLNITDGQTIESNYDGSHSYELTYGYNIYSQNLGCQLNSTSNFKFNMPIKFIGIGASSGAENIKTKSTDTPFFIAKQFYFQYFMRQNIKIDSISYKTGGYSFNLGFGKCLHNKKHTLNLIGYIGFNTGRIVLKSEEYKTQQNLFFNPKLCLQPKIIIGSLSLSIIAEYQYDVTNPEWKNSKFKKDDNFTLRNFNQSGFSALFCIGYHHVSN